jgi:hypothetical protein
VDDAQTEVSQTTGRMHGDILELDPNFRTIFEYEFSHVLVLFPLGQEASSRHPHFGLASVEGFVRWDWLDILGRTKGKERRQQNGSFPPPESIPIGVSRVCSLWLWVYNQDRTKSVILFSTHFFTRTPTSIPFLRHKVNSCVPHSLPSPFPQHTHIYSLAIALTMVKQVVVPSIVTASTSVLCGVILVGVLLAADPVNAFVPVRLSSHHPTQAVGDGIAFVRLDAAAAETTSINHAVATAGASSGEPKKKTLGLLTFDLDDTLYPIAPVIDEANAAFARAMARFGYQGLTPMDIVETGKLIREEIAAQNPKSAVVLTHTEIRELSIRREMENIMLAKKLKETADDWATPVSDLASIVVANAKK